MASMRGTFKDGVIVLEGDPTALRLRDGDAVEVRKGKSSRKPRVKAVRRSTPVKIAIEAMIGVERERPDWKGRSSAEIADELRRNAARRKTRR
ncbi:MAG TPA: hypothetical protein VD971_06070 [Phycisphaerales bacterium]|nr:hypothetical protein [Phycisphaerales bacterium]